MNENNEERETDINPLKREREKDNEKDGMEGRRLNYQAVRINWCWQGWWKSLWFRSNYHRCSGERKCHVERCTLYFELINLLRLSVRVHNIQKIRFPKLITRRQNGSEVDQNSVFAKTDVDTKPKFVTQILQIECK